MPKLLYAEITIITNLKEEPIFNYFNRLLLGNENQTNDNDTIIILFDDGTICDVKSENKKGENIKGENIKGENIKNKFIMGLRRSNSPLPGYIEIKDNNVFFLKSPYEKNGMKRLNFNTIFANNKKYLTSERVPSVYNSIYRLTNHDDMLAIVKIKSNKESPRFLLTYDESFLKDDIIYLVDYIFS